MPNWTSVLREISLLQAVSNENAFDKTRRKYLKRLSQHTGRNVIAYYSGFLSKPGLDGVQITDEDKNGLMLCIHELDRSKGLDLILHTPGGDSQASISLVDYLRSMFGNNIRAIVPQLAMSAGTMIACSCFEIVMGKQSSLGPVDPQFGFIAAANLIAEVKRAQAEISANPSLAMFWNPILSKITPSFLERCAWAIRDSNEFIEKTLRDNMLSHLELEEQNNRIASIKNIFANNEGRAHNTHINLETCESVGLRINRLESDQKFQDLILTIHHCYTHTLGNTAAFKVIENQLGRAMVKQQVIQMPPGIYPVPSGAVFGEMPEVQGPEVPMA
ncbi:S49 family peptidase [Siculibacillus lacustris]|uniref:S49 family peptidase n=1 Tax=Siculibacillus lacustris TaxID=1549641 RepID=A0A4Q9VG05_9HYPH|nr:S49 family peptidase [Siculibacillus lacustris]TBW33336.1 S49 family peptidase [Siculibacillus lacustris]